jgi:hypothetical protein
MGEKRGGCLGWLFKVGLALFFLVGLLTVLSSRSGTRPQTPVSQQPPAIDERQQRIDEAAARAKQQAAESIAQEIQIPSLKASDVYSITTSQGFTLKTYPVDSPHEWTTSKETEYGVLQLDCHGRSESDIYSINLTGGAAPGWDKEIAADVAKFFPDAVGKLRIEGVDPKASAQWVSNNIGSQISETFGPCEFKLVKGTGFGLEIRMKR